MKNALVVFGKFLLFFVCWFGVLTIIFNIAGEPRFLASNPAMLRLYQEFIPLLLVLIATFVFIKFFESYRFKIIFINNITKDILTGIFVSVVWVASTFIVLYIVGVIGFNDRNTIKYLPIWVIALLFNTIMQEFLIRGYLFDLLRNNYGRIIATIVTTALFTFLHGFGSGFLNFLNIASMSIFMTFLMVCYNSLLVPIIVHFVWNFVYGILINGIQLANDYPNIFNITLSGGKLLSGGEAGIEGSIIIFFINIILIVLSLILLLKKERDSFIYVH